MTRQKSFKSRVRARMDKTGESYTAARRNLLPRTPEPEAPEGVRPTRISEESVRQRTGRGWDEWFALLDAWGADRRTHTEIARWLVEEHQVGGWSAQSIAVAYEQARGMRVPGQRGDGFFRAGASKTIAAPVERLYEAFTDPEVRERWLPGADLRIRTATPGKSVRADWADGSTRVVVGFVVKGEAKAQVAIQHEKLTDADTAARQKAYWRDRLADLKRIIEEPGAV
ncbi:MAG TPA: DUF4287 domain-containing protein [Thermomonospora sp.]|nr:DUF4287 domain-containing protein [Thermomonospora sp.]